PMDVMPVCHGRIGLGHLKRFFPFLQRKSHISHSEMQRDAGFQFRGEGKVCKPIAHCPSLMDLGRVANPFFEFCFCLSLTTSKHRVPHSSSAAAERVHRRELAVITLRRAGASATAFPPLLWL